jgi:hypothetical protein
VIDKDASHQFRNHGEEMRAVLPAQSRYIKEPQVGLVDQGGGLDRVLGALAAQATPCEVSQLWISRVDNLS